MGGQGHSKPKSMSYAQRKRAKMDYRSEYFAHNPGLFGCIWWCAYCKRPLVGKSSVEVDHIMPLDDPRGRNRRYNLVASCMKCNRNKSNSVDRRVLEGRISKLVEVAVFSVQKVFLIAFVGIWSIILCALRCFLNVIKLPFKNSTTKMKIVASIFYAAVIYIVYQKLFC